jgi:nucleotide-binding universal stress UspA family protein
MYRHLLIAIDGSDLARAALDHGFALAKALGAEVTVITVTEPWDVVVIPEAAIAFPPAGYDESVAASSAQILSEASETARRQGIACRTRHVPDRYPAEGIAETAKELGCDLIVMASHGRRGVRRLVLGSVANEVVTQSAVPVLICR